VTAQYREHQKVVHDHETSGRTHFHLVEPTLQPATRICSTDLLVNLFRAADMTLSCISYVASKRQARHPLGRDRLGHENSGQ
jgi:hypothetical protein